MRASAAWLAASAAAFLSVGALLSGQTPDSAPIPYVASVKVNASGSDSSFTRRLPGGTFLASNILLRDLIAFAHGLQPFQIEGAPDWIGTVRVDVTIKAETNVAPVAIGPTQIGLQLTRAVLAERFSFRAHRETRERPRVRARPRAAGRPARDRVSGRAEPIAPRSLARPANPGRPGRRGPPTAAFCAVCRRRETR